MKFTRLRVAVPHDGICDGCSRHAVVKAKFEEVEGGETYTKILCNQCLREEMYKHWKASTKTDSGNATN